MAPARAAARARNPAGEARREGRARCSGRRSPPSSCRPRFRTSRRSRRSSARASARSRQLGLLVVFNVCFVLPLIAIVATLTFAGDQARAGSCATWRGLSGPALARGAGRTARCWSGSWGSCSGSPAWPRRATGAWGASSATSGRCSTCTRNGHYDRDRDGRHVADNELRPGGARQAARRALRGAPRPGPRGARAGRSSRRRSRCPTAEYREHVLDWAQTLAGEGLTAPGFPREFGGLGDPGANVAAFETLGVRRSVAARQVRGPVRAVGRRGPATRHRAPPRALPERDRDARAARLLRDDRDRARLERPAARDDGDLRPRARTSS